jgi:hypothetical protein
MAVNPRDIRKLMNHADQADELDIEHIQFTPFGRVPFRPMPFERRFERFPFERRFERFPFERRFERFPFERRFERFPFEQFPFRRF